MEKLLHSPGEPELKFIRESGKWIAAIALFAVIAAIYSYRAAMANFFTGDDFVYLNWLHLAWVEPSRLWSVFWSNSLDAQSTHFYRPLLSLSMALDKAIWGYNALGFHATNLFFHTACSVIIYFLTKHIFLPYRATGTIVLWPVAASGLFLLYPLHPEVVTWIGGRVDCVATFFVISSFYSYAEWRSTGSARWFYLCLVCDILALCSKEFAVVLPAWMVIYELLMVPKITGVNATSLRVESKPVTATMLSRCSKAFKTTFVYWIVLGLYFIVRRISLGTFIGGYDDKLGLTQDFAAFVHNWQVSLVMLFVPINQTLVSPQNNLLVLPWVLAVLASVALLVHTYLKSPALRPATNFLICSTVLFLLPVYKLMSIAEDLQSSRLGYFATVPLCCLLSLGITQIFLLKQSMKIFSLRLTGFAVLVLFGLSAFWLNVNNKAWEMAGRASNNLQKAFATIEAQGIQNCLVLGAPDGIHGAFVARNAFNELHHQAVKVQNLPPIDYCQPAGALKTALLKDTSRSVYAFDDKSLNLVKLDMPHMSGETTEQYRGSALKTIFPNANATDFNENGLKANCAEPLTMQLGRERSSIDAIVVEFQTRGQLKDPLPKISFFHSISGINWVEGRRFLDTNKVLFEFRGLPSWQLDRKPMSKILLCELPKNAERITAVSFVNMNDLAPGASESSVDETGDINGGALPGHVRIDSASDSATINFDASKIAYADHVLLTISRPDIPRDNFNSARRNKENESKSIRIAKRSGFVKLERSDFKIPGDYCINIWATNAENETVGLCSDNVIVTVR